MPEALQDDVSSFATIIIRPEHWEEKCHDAVIDAVLQT